MGRLVKNTLFESGNYALGLAAQNASFRPNVAGFTSQTALRYSTTSDKLEYYAHSGNVWQTVSNVGSGTSRITKDSFTAPVSGTSTEFGPMAFTYYPGWEANVLVHVGSVYQIPTTNYTFYGNTTIHFASAPSANSAITIIHGLNSTIAS